MSPIPVDPKNPQPQPPQRLYPDPRPDPNNPNRPYPDRPIPGPTQAEPAFRQAVPVKPGDRTETVRIDATNVVTRKVPEDKPFPDPPKKQGD